VLELLGSNLHSFVSASVLSLVLSVLLVVLQEVASLAMHEVHWLLLVHMLLELLLVGLAKPPVLWLVILLLEHLVFHRLALLRLFVFWRGLNLSWLLREPQPLDSLKSPFLLLDLLRPLAPHTDQLLAS
jgi:hypothetical protein